MSLQARVADRAARLADDARVRAYETLGDRPRAVQILERRLSVDWAQATGDGPILPRFSLVTRRHALPLWS